MSNPWLNIPLDDCEGHMSLPAIGCAGGNGLDRIVGRTVERVVAVDVNPDYIERTHDRYAEVLCAEL
jgi:hypothetical protein